MLTGENNPQPVTNNDGQPNPFFLAIHDVLAGHEPEHGLDALTDPDDTALTHFQSNDQHLQHVDGNVRHKPQTELHLQHTLTSPPVVHSIVVNQTSNGTHETSRLLPNSITTTVTHTPPNTDHGTDNLVVNHGLLTTTPHPQPVVSVPDDISVEPNTDGVATVITKRRGLAYAQQVRNSARTEFKLRRRRELEAAGETERVTRRRRNDTSLSKRGKYLRRLQKNQDSAAAARAGSDAFIQCLEQQCERYDPDVQKLALKLDEVKRQRDREQALHAQIVAHNLHLLNMVRSLRQATAVTPTLPDNPEDELGFVRMPNAR